MKKQKINPADSEEVLQQLLWSQFCKINQQWKGKKKKKIQPMAWHWLYSSYSLQSVSFFFLFAPLAKNIWPYFKHRGNDEKQGTPTFPGLPPLGREHSFPFLLTLQLSALTWTNWEWLRSSNSISSWPWLPPTGAKRHFGGTYLKGWRLLSTLLTPPIFSVLLLTWVSLIDTPACLSLLNPMHF